MIGWCLKKFCNEKKYQRRFIRLDRGESAFCWYVWYGMTGEGREV